MTAKEQVKILITGFDVSLLKKLTSSSLTYQDFLNIKANPSWQITQRLPKDTIVQTLPVVLIVPAEPLKVAYHSIATTVKSLVDEHEPDLILHVGLEATRTSYGLEVGAFRDGYHDIPDEARRVFSRAESKKIWGKSPDRLDTDFDVEAVVRSWKQEVITMDKKRKEKGRNVDVEASDDVGNYVCGFVYYFSLERCWREKRKKSVVFLHVPFCEGPEEIGKGVQVVMALVKALVENWKQDVE